MFTFPVVRKLYRYTIGPNGLVRSVAVRKIYIPDQDMRSGMHAMNIINFAWKSFRGKKVRFEDCRRCYHTRMRIF